jgi:ribonucleotide reductase beta subunit family protein with ferritin-like domain
MASSTILDSTCNDSHEYTLNDTLISNIQYEPLFDPENDRVNLLPIQYPIFWEYYKNAKASFWIPEEIDLSEDVKDWNTKLTNGEKQFLEANFALFLIFDQIVIKNLETNFVEKITIPEIRMVYRFQEMIEDIHVHAYALFPITFIKDPKRIKEINNAVKTFPILNKMLTWCKKWINEENSIDSFVRRLVAFIMIEGIIFSGSFASIFYMKKQQKMSGIAQANELIARDEGLHTKFGLEIYHFLNTKIPESTYIQMLNEVVDMAVEFSTVSIPVDMVGMNNKLMVQYIKCVSDNISLSIIKHPVYKAENPFPWMELINLQGQTNFFDKKVTNYSRTSVMNKTEDNVIGFDAEF